MTSITVYGVDAGSGTVREADDLLTDLVRRFGLPAGVMCCTHLIRTGAPHVAVSLALPDHPGPAVADRVRAALPDGAAVALLDETGMVVGEAGRRRTELAAGAGQAAAEHGRSGRAVLYPGAARLTGTMTVRDLLDRSAIDQVAVLMAGAPAPETRIMTRGYW
ncbi:MAG: hypothetical protein JWO67_3708 [Streptosporangiaceae bacterium]|nr:hypothetical protein [Streptosporangiaceae bacterium]